MKLFFTVFTLYLGFIVYSGDDLQIINPILFINQKDPEITDVGKKQIVSYKTKVMYAIYNSSEKTISVATKSHSQTTVFGIASKDTLYTGSLLSLPQGTLLLQLDMNTETFLIENQEAGLPKIPIVRSLSSFEIVELRPGEATMISCDLQLKKDVFQKMKKIIF